MIDKELLAQSSRDALGLYFEYKNKGEEFETFLEEKSDYEILHLIATGKFPSKNFNITEQCAINKITSEENMLLVESFFVNPIKYWRDVIKSYNPANILNTSFDEWIKKLPEYNLSRYAKDIQNIETAMKNPTLNQFEKIEMQKTKEMLLRQIDRKGDSYRYEQLVAELNKQKESLKNSSLGATLSKFSGNAMLTLSALAAVALVIYFGYKVYQRFFSEAGKACNSYSGDVKTKCMKKYKADSIKRQISEIEKGMPLCDRTNDSVRCQEMLHQKIRKLKAKIRQLG